MKIKINKNTFAQALADVSVFASTKLPIEVLRNAKFTTKGNRMKIQTNDTKNAMTKYIEVMECDTDGSFLMNVEDIKNYLAKIKSNEITLSVENGTAVIAHSKGSANIVTQPAELFIEFDTPTEDIKSEISFESKVLANMIKKAKDFVNHDSLRPQMCGIYAYIENESIGFCATDSHKLIYGKNTGSLEIKQCADSNTDVHWLIMPSIFSSLANECSKSDMVTITITSKKVVYRINNTIIYSVQAEGVYPNFKRVIPDKSSMECVIDKNELIDSLSRASLFCDTSRCVRIDLSEMDMTLTVDNIDFQKKIVESISHHGCDGSLVIGANVSSMIVCLKAFDSDMVKLMFGDSSRPILFRSPSDEDMTGLLMPMSLLA